MMSCRNHFKIIIPLYNVEKWIKPCLNSVLLQDYDNYECIIVDDCSNDKTPHIIKDMSLPKQFKVITNQKNVGPLENAYLAVVKHSTELDSDDIVVILDGDDFFASKEVLSTLNDFYNQEDCWMTYGSYINLSNRQKGKFSTPVPERIIQENSYRQAPWSTSHLRSYKAFLVQKIQIEDLMDNNGEFYRAAGDLAMMFPLLEMCGPRAKFIDKILYIWNDCSDLNEHKSKRELQLRCEREIRQAKKYDRLLER